MSLNKSDVILEMARKKFYEIYDEKAISKQLQDELCWTMGGTAEKYHELVSFNFFLKGGALFTIFSLDINRQTGEMVVVTAVPASEIPTWEELEHLDPNKEYMST